MELVKRKLYKLFGKYSNADETSSSQPRSSTTRIPLQSVGAVKGKSKRIFDEMMAYESQTITSAGKSQLDLYLEKPKLEFAYYQDLDVLEHWKNQKHRYPILSLMACDVLAIPITTVASESAFPLVLGCLPSIEVLLFLKMCKLLFVLAIGYMTMLSIKIKKVMS